MLSIILLNNAVVCGMCRVSSSSHDLQLNCFKVPPEMLPQPAPSGATPVTSPAAVTAPRVRPVHTYLYLLPALSGGMKMQCPPHATRVTTPMPRSPPDRRPKDWFEIDTVLASDQKSSNKYIHNLQHWSSITPMTLLQVMGCGLVVLCCPG